MKFEWMVTWEYWGFLIPGGPQRQWIANQYDFSTDEQAAREHALFLLGRRSVEGVTVSVGQVRTVQLFRRPIRNWEEVTI